LARHPTIVDSAGREFALFPVSVCAFIVDPSRQFLLLRHPKRGPALEVVAGLVDQGETLVDAVLREIREEAGEALNVRPLGIFHAYSVRYDDTIPAIVSACFLLQATNAVVATGSDMAGSEFRWLSLDELRERKHRIIVPEPGEGGDGVWFFERALACLDLWGDGPSATLQPSFSQAWIEQGGRK